MIRAVIFDFGNVLCTVDILRFVQNLCAQTGRPADTIRQGIHASASLIKEYETGLISSDDFFMRVNALTGLTLSQEKFRTAYCNIFSPIAPTFALIHALKPRYALGLLSNTNPWHFECAIRPVEVFPLFDAVTLSYVVKAMKPAEAIYRDMLRKLSVEPDACAYIDDIRENVDAAEHLGMHGILYTSHEYLLAQLASAGVSAPVAFPSNFH